MVEVLTIGAIQVHFPFLSYTVSTIVVGVKIQLQFKQIFKIIYRECPRTISFQRHAVIVKKKCKRGTVPSVKELSFFKSQIVNPALLVAFTYDGVF